jgi:hypothetical protein
MRRRIAIIILVVAAMVAPAAFDVQNPPPGEKPATAQPPTAQKPPGEKPAPPTPASETPPATAAPAAAQPPAAVQPATPALAFKSNAGIILSPIKPDQAAVFEEVMAKVKEALAKSADPARKQQATGWTVYKAAEPYQGFTLYVSVLDPTLAGASYNVFELLQESLGDKEARELFERFRNAHVAGHNILNLTTVMSMSGS